MEFAFKEIFSVSFGVSATNVNISDYFNTKDVELVQNSIIPTPSAIDIENGKITWTLDTISAEKSYSMEFDLLLHNLKPGEERQINKDLTVDFVAPESGANLNINVGEQFVKVKEFGTVSIATDKEQYTAKEILQAESKIALIGNQIKRYADWDLKDLNNIVLDTDSSRLKLTSTSDPEWRNLVLNGDFELGDK